MSGLAMNMMSMHCRNGESRAMVKLGFGRVRAGLAVMAMSLALTGCISLGEDPPATLFTLTPSSLAPAGQSNNGTAAQALLVLDPDAPQKLNVARVPVQVDDSTVAYLADAMWVEKPARLFGRLLAETIRAKQTRMVIEGADIQYSAATRLSGKLVEMGYDVLTSSVIVRYDAVLQQSGGQIRTRRFEAEVNGVAAEARFVAPALNDAANTVAAEVAEWVG